ncbi:MAG: TIGR02206 family membrane protein [Candidatus Izemoplasma sp.]
MSFSDFIEHEINSDFIVDPFSIQYFIFVMIGVLSVVLTLRYAKKVKTWKHEKALKKTIGFGLVTLEIIYHIHNYVNGIFSIPIHISSFSMMFSMIILFSDNRTVFGVLYYLGILAGLAAFFAPGMLNYTFYHIRFYHFILVHMAIIVVPIYYYKAYNYTINLIDLRVTLVFLILISPLIIFVNYQLDRNYMFIGELPEVLVPIMPVWPYYIAVYLVLITILFLGLYFLTNFKDIFERWEKYKKLHL